MYQNETNRMALTPKFKNGDRVVYFDGLIYKIVGVHVNTFLDEKQDYVCYSCEDTRISDVDLLIKLYNESDLSFAVEPDYYKFEIVMRLPAGEDRSYMDIDAQTFLTRIEEITDGYRWYVFECSPPEKITTFYP